jgi:hypothetical protein
VEQQPVLPDKKPPRKKQGTRMCRTEGCGKPEEEHAKYKGRRYCPVKWSDQKTEQEWQQWIDAQMKEVRAKSDAGIARKKEEGGGRYRRSTSP